MRSYWRFPLALSLITSACSPACTPPDAEPPLTSQQKDQAKASDGQSASAKADDSAPAAGDMIMEAKGIDLSKLNDSQRKDFFKVINIEASACDKPHSLATSLRDDAACHDSKVVAQFVAESLAAGTDPGDIKAQVAFIADALKPKEINIEGRPVFGNAKAPVTMVVFADFECPHCAKEAPVLREVVKKYRGQVKLVFKHFPLGGHDRAKDAAIACEAAHVQGKFWEMHDLVFANQMALEEAQILSYAKQIKGLDYAAFEKHYKAKKGSDIVEKDRQEGDLLGIEGTPAVYVNGRAHNPVLFGGTFEGWIEDALRR